MSFTTDDIKLRSLDQDGTGSTVFYDPGYTAIDEPETEIIYPKIVDTLAEEQIIEPSTTVPADYIAEECIDCETQPELIPNPTPIAATADTTTEPTTSNKIVSWIKENPFLALGAGAALYFLLADKNKRKRA